MGHVDANLLVPRKRNLRLMSLVLAAATAVACGGDGDQDGNGSGTGGRGDAGTPTGGTSGGAVAGTTGNESGGRDAAGSSAGGAAAAAGTGTAGDAGRGGDGSSAGGGGGGTGGASGTGGSDASIDDVDLTLGGFNQDLPAPSVDCLANEDVVASCMAISGEYNDEPFSFVCEDESGMVSIGGSHAVSCRGQALGGDLNVRLALAPAMLDMPPVTFAVEAATQNTFASVQQFARDLANYAAGAYALDATHDQSFRVAGLSALVQGPSSEDWRVDGAFALSLAVKAGCAPDPMGYGCDEIRMRGNFRMFPIEQ